MSFTNASVGSSLPPSSPPQPFSDFDDVDEEPMIADEIPDLEEDEEGEGIYSKNSVSWKTDPIFRSVWAEHGPRLYPESRRGCI